ncbi:MAG: hypothetical protein KAT46_05170 [Deltaproteobacteria bacterium]|nr:hypothetical protein [Deltaproteobacteria bacterium]
MRSQKAMRVVFSLVFFFVLFSLSIMFFCGGELYAGNKSKATRVILTADIDGKIEVDEFDCREKVFIYLEFRGLKKGTHKILASWIKPGGEEQQRSNVELEVKAEGKTYATWLWLKLSAGTGGGFFGDIDPTMGMEDFLGRWEVNLYIDEKFIIKKIFYVAC